MHEELPSIVELTAEETELANLRDDLADERHANEHLSAALARAQQGWKVALDDLSAVSAELAMLCAGLPEWHCPSCGATTRARMADHQDKETDRG